jgi:hypothetical protein
VSGGNCGQSSDDSRISGGLEKLELQSSVSLADPNLTCPCLKVEGDLFANLSGGIGRREGRLTRQVCEPTGAATPRQSSQRQKEELRPAPTTDTLTSPPTLHRSGSRAKVQKRSQLHTACAPEAGKFASSRMRLGAVLHSVVARTLRRR